MFNTAMISVLAGWALLSALTVSVGAYFATVAPR